MRYLLLYLFALVSSVSNAQFSLDSIIPANHYRVEIGGRVSAGVYDANDVLVRTLMKGELRGPGDYPMPVWDGLDDQGNAATGESIKVVSNYMSAECRGAIGNASPKQTGKGVSNYFQHYHDMVKVGGTKYYAADYSESKPPVVAYDESNPGLYRATIDDFFPRQMTSHIAVDDSTIYMAGLQSFNNDTSYVQAAYLHDFNSWKNYLPFQGETVPGYGREVPACDITLDAGEGRVTGLAVQQNGNYLLVARKGLNSLHILDKRTGLPITDITIPEAALVKTTPGGGFWIVSRDTARRYGLNEGGVLSVTLTSDFITAPGIAKGMAVNPSGTRLLTMWVDTATRRNYLQVHSLPSLALEYELGENMATNPAVKGTTYIFNYPDKQDEVDKYSYGTWVTDDTFEIGDQGNWRHITLNSSGEILDSIVWAPALYNVKIDSRDSSRVFLDWNEYKVDWTKNFLNGNEDKGWVHVRNWSAKLDSTNIENYNRLSGVTTLSNGRTYALTPTVPAGSQYEVIELDIVTGIRFTGVLTPPGEFTVELQPDGNIYYRTESGTTTTLRYWELIGFDVNHNPQYEAQVFASYTTDDHIRQGGPQVMNGELTDQDEWVVFNGGRYVGPHLGVIGRGETEFRFKTAYDSSVIPMTNNGAFQIAGYNSTGNAGSIGMSFDSIVVYGYNGEFYLQSQTNVWNFYTSDGLFLYQIRRIGNDLRHYDSPEGMGGNAFSAQVMKIGEYYYLIHCTENFHGGAMIWRLSNSTYKKTVFAVP